MTARELGRIGISLDVSPDDSHLDEAAEVEQLGYSTIWLSGGQLDTLGRITDVVRATKTISVGPAIIAPDVYGSAEVAKLYADLEAEAPGRLVVGLGGSQQPRSLAALHTYLDDLDTADPPVPAERRVLAALGPRKLDIARSRCAGAITLLVSPSYTRHARQALGDHATLVVDEFVVLDPDPERARKTARTSLEFLSGVGGYRTNFTRMGYTDTEISTLDDRLVDDLTVSGDEEAIAARVRAQFAAGADQVVLAAQAGDGHPSAIEVARRMSGVFAG